MNEEIINLLDDATKLAAKINYYCNKYQDDRRMFLMLIALSEHLSVKSLEISNYLQRNDK